MTDLNVFILGCIVFLIASMGAFLYVYSRFREAYFEENPVEEANPRPREKVGPAFLERNQAVHRTA